MNYKHRLPSTSPQKNSFVNLQPKPAWMAILGLVLFSTLCTVIGAGKLLNLAFPAGSFAVGVFLYRRYPLLYVGFTWWMFFLTPLLRRLVDYRSGFTEPSPILLAPFLVAIVTLATFYRHLPRSYHQGGLPFVLCCVGTFYGFLIALIKLPPIAAIIALLNWLAPILFGFHLFVSWEDYPSYRQNMQRIFVWCVLLTGAYGVYQYIVAPVWDREWLINTELFTSMGSPVPFGLRVWSTMNSILPFATVMMAGLIVLLSSHGALRIPASIVGYLALLLSTVRTAWGGWVIAFITHTMSLKATSQMRLIISIVVLAICVFPLATIEPFSSVIQSRFSSFSNLSEDTSFNDRSTLYATVLNQALGEFIGYGIGSTSAGFDSGIMDILLSLGWFGTIPYLGGMLMLFLKLFQSREVRSDPFASAARAISLGILPMLIGGSVMAALAGMVLWGFLGIGMAACKYHQHQKLNLKIVSGQE